MTAQGLGPAVPIRTGAHEARDGKVPWRATATGVDVIIRVTPRASRTAITGCEQDQQGRPVLLIRLAAPPVEGAANEALVGFMAEALGLRKRDLVVRSGQTSRTKIVGLTGDPKAISARLAALLCVDQ